MIHANCTIEVQTKRKENSLAKTGVDHFMKTEEHKKRQTEMQIGCRWTNNGIKNKRIYKNEEIPEGFKLEFLQKTSKK